MSLFTVAPTGAGTIEVYGGSVACDQYLAGMIGDGADAYAVSDPNTRLKLLVAATRYIERQFWRGTPTAPPVGSTTLSWPRTGIDDIDPNSVPPVLVNAVFELVALAADDPDILAVEDQGSNVASLGAGSARISFFTNSSVNDGSATALPTVIDQMIGRFLATADPAFASASAGVATGTGGRGGFGCCSSCNADPCSCIDERRSWPL